MTSRELRAPRGLVHARLAPGEESQSEQICSYANTGSCSALENTKERPPSSEQWRNVWKEFTRFQILQVLRLKNCKLEQEIPGVRRDRAGAEGAEPATDRAQPAPAEQAQRQTPCASEGLIPALRLSAAQECAQGFTTRPLKATATLE